MKKIYVQSEKVIRKYSVHIHNTPLSEELGNKDTSWPPIMHQHILQNLYCKLVDISNHTCYNGNRLCEIPLIKILKPLEFPLAKQPAYMLNEYVGLNLDFKIQGDIIYFTAHEWLDIAEQLLLTGYVNKEIGGQNNRKITMMACKEMICLTSEIWQTNVQQSNKTPSRH